MCVCMYIGSFFFLNVFVYVLALKTGNGSAAVVMRRAATWCLKPRGRAELILSPLSQAGMPGTPRYTHLSKEIQPS